MQYNVILLWLLSCNPEERGTNDGLSLNVRVVCGWRGCAVAGVDKLILSVRILTLHYRGSKDYWLRSGCDLLSLARYGTSTGVVNLPFHGWNR
jgi:hypothetical protein